MKCSLAVFLGLSAVASYPTRANGMCEVNGESTDIADRIKFSVNGNDVTCTNPEKVRSGGCIEARIVGCDHVLCKREACREATVPTATSVRCRGIAACTSANITATATVDCAGTSACSVADITIDATDADVSTPPVVTCNGPFSCRTANVNAGPSGIIVCSGDSACDGFLGTRTTTLTGACLQCLNAGACSSRCTSCGSSCTWSPDSTTPAVACPTSGGTLGTTCPSSMPSMAPSTSMAPSALPTDSPSNLPTLSTDAPSMAPSDATVKSSKKGKRSKARSQIFIGPHVR
eukprot:scaffold3902_cov53-Attheya_sp.AAC.5